MIAVIGVAIAFRRELPGVAVLLGTASMITVVPAVAVTELTAQWRCRRGQPMPREQRYSWILTLSFVLPFVLCALCFAVLIALNLYPD